VPLVGGFANTLLDKFVPNSGNTAQSALNINNIPGPKGLSTGTEWNYNNNLICSWFIFWSIIWLWL
jgi:hypothetical protein